MDDIAKRVEQGKDDLIRQLMTAKMKRRGQKNAPPPEEAPAEEAAPAELGDGLTDEDRDELARHYGSLK